MVNNDDGREAIITIHGREYRIKSMGDASYTKKLAAHCNDVMKQVERATKSNDYLQLCILSMLQIAHQAHNGDEHTAEVIEGIDDQLVEIIASIDKGREEAKKAAGEKK